MKINRRQFVGSITAGLVGLALPRLSSGAEGAGRRPNFVFILADDQNWNGLSVQMHDGIPGSKSDFYRTSNLEKLASQGMRFSAAYAPSPVCSPTRYSLQTGKSPAQLHWTKAAPTMAAEDGYKLVPPKIERQIDSREVTIAEMLKRAGYATAHYGKWHLSGGGPERHGYDESDGDTSNRDADAFGDPDPADIFGITKRCNAFMEKHSKIMPDRIAELDARLTRYLRDVKAQLPKPNPRYDPKRTPPDRRRRKTRRRD